MPLELRQLRYAVIAAEAHSFRQAAQILRVRQTTLSKRILLLEQRIGVTLFERTKRGAVPTRAGLEFTRNARRIFDEVELLRINAKAVSRARPVAWSSASAPRCRLGIFGRSSTTSSNAFRRSRCRWSNAA